MQCIRTVTLAAVLFELFPFVDFSCLEHNFNTIIARHLIFGIQIDVDMGKCGA